MFTSSSPLPHCTINTLIVCCVRFHNKNGDSLAYEIVCFYINAFCPYRLIVRSTASNAQVELVHINLLPLIYRNVWDISIYLGYIFGIYVFNTF